MSMRTNSGLCKRLTAWMFITLLFICSLALSPASAMNDNVLVCDIWPPYQMESRSGVEGFSVDVVLAVYERLGEKAPEIKAFPWKRAVEMVKHGRVLGIFSANKTPERQVYMRYPDEPIVETPWVIWTRGKDRVKSLSDLKGKKVGVVLGYSYTHDFWKYIETYSDIEKVHSDEVNFMKLDAGRLHAVAAELGNGLYLANRLGTVNIVPNMEIAIKSDGLYIAFSRDRVSKEFVDAFTRELRLFKATGEFLDLREKYFGLPQ